MQPSARASAAVLALLAVGTPAAAQMWAGIGPRGVAMPGAAPPAPASPAARAAQPQTAPVAGATTVLRHLPAPLDGWRISGENGELRWPLFLTRAQAGAPLRLRIGYMSAVSVLPETSSLRLRINGRVVGADPIDAPQGLRRIAFAIPAGLLKPGFNEVALVVEQRHRVDCSVAATYELWTRIDPVETGLELPADATGVDDVADLPALAPRPDGATPIHVVLSGRTNPSHLGRLVRATQALALRGRMGQPLVDFAQNAGEPYGLDLALGTREALAKLPRLAPSLGSSGPLATLVPGVAGARPTLIVTGSDDREVDAAIAGLARLPEPFGSARGLVAAANLPALPATGDQTLTLRDLGQTTQDFNGRFFRRSFAFSLPADTLAADYGRGTFDLAGGYASGLRGAQVRVDVNGRNSGIIKLPYADGEVFKHNQLFLPLGMMRPGINRIDIYAETPREADASCAASFAKRFLLLDSSRLRLPTLARVERLPDLALATAGALPFTQGQAHLVVPKPDRDTMGAALSLTARVAVAAGRVVPFAFATKMPTAGDGSTLVVSPARALDPGTMTRVGLDPAAVEAAWRGAAEARPAAEGTAGAVQARWWLDNPDGPAACKLPPHAASVAGTAPKSPRAPSKDGDDILDQASGDPQASGWRDRLGEWAEAVRTRLRFPGSTSPVAGVDADASLLLAQGVSDGDGDVTTIVTAPDAATLKAGVGCLFDPQVWSKVHGRLAALDASSGTVVATDATSFTYRGASGASLGNGRLVLAGWFSLNPLAFVAMSLLLALCLSGTTLWFVRGVGRRSE